MGSIKFKYSLMQMIRSIALLLFFALISYVRIAEDGLDDNGELIFDIIVVIIFVRFVYLCAYIYIPCLRGETALELDEEKLQFFVKGKFRSRDIKDLILWNDVAHIKLDPFPRNTGALITFKMLSGDTFSIKTTHVAGKDREIYDAIVSCFNKRLKPIQEIKTGFKLT